MAHNSCDTQDAKNIRAGLFTYYVTSRILGEDEICQILTEPTDNRRLLMRGRQNTLCKDSVKEFRAEDALSKFCFEYVLPSHVWTFVCRKASMRDLKVELSCTNYSSASTIYIQTIQHYSLLKSTIIIHRLILNAILCLLNTPYCTKRTNTKRITFTL